MWRLLLGCLLAFKICSQPTGLWSAGLKKSERSTVLWQQAWSSLGRWAGESSPLPAEGNKDPTKVSKGLPSSPAGCRARGKGAVTQNICLSFFWALLGGWLEYFTLGLERGFLCLGLQPCRAVLKLSWSNERFIRVSRQGNKLVLWLAGHAAPVHARLQRNWPVLATSTLPGHNHHHFCSISYGLDTCCQVETRGCPSPKLAQLLAALSPSTPGATYPSA